MLSTFRQALNRLGKVAADLQALTEAAWLIKVAAYINAAHYLEEAVRDCRAVMLLSQQASTEQQGPADEQHSIVDAVGLELRPVQQPLFSPDSAAVLYPVSQVSRLHRISGTVKIKSDVSASL